MRLAVVTDIHGNLGAFLAVLADLRTQAPDLVVFGGDAALFGAHGLECWQRLLDLGWPSVQGNTDRYLVNPHPVLRGLRETSPAAADHLERNVAWTRAQLGDRLVERMASMRTVVRVPSAAGPLVVVHAAPGNDEAGIHPDASDEQLSPRIAAVDATVLICGHTHRAFVRHVGHLLVVNCGSVGRTYDGQPGQGTYAVLDDASSRWSATLRRIPYDARAAHRDTRARGVPLSEPFLASLLTARDPAA